MSVRVLDVGDLGSGFLTVEYDELETQAYAAAAASEDAGWWETAYAGGPPVGPSELVRPLYFPGNPAGKAASSDGPDVVAVKRAVWRGGRWQGPASSFDDSFSRGFALGVGGNVIQTGLAGFQRQMRLQATGQLGDQTYQAMRYARVPETFPHGGEPLFDALAVSLLEKAELAGGGSLTAVRAAIASYCAESIAFTAGIHYAQERPIACFGVEPIDGFTTDCSGHATCAYYYSGAPDPNGRGFDGYGYTGTLLNNPEVSAPYEVGDLAIYGPSTSATSHVCTCMEAGDASSARWCSHGSEAAPSKVSLHYRSDLLEVVRPRLV